jgi:hypothetical protein
MRWVTGTKPLQVQTRLGMGFRLAIARRSPRRIAQSVGVIGPVGQKDIACTHAIEHVGGTAFVVGLARRDLEQDRQAVGIDQRVDLGGQPASRTPHASGVSSVPGRGLRTPFLLLEPC